MEKIEMPAQLLPAKARKPRAKQLPIPAVEQAIKAARVARRVIALIEASGVDWALVDQTLAAHFQADGEP